MGFWKRLWKLFFPRPVGFEDVEVVYDNAKAEFGDSAVVGQVTRFTAATIARVQGVSLSYETEGAEAVKVLAGKIMAVEAGADAAVAEIEAQIAALETEMAQVHADADGEINDLGNRKAKVSEVLECLGVGIK